MDKPRECRCKQYGLPHEYVPMIEKSHADALEKELAEAKRERDYYMSQFSCSNDTVFKWIEEGEKLYRQIREMREALIAAAEFANIDDINGEAGRIAREVLNKYWPRGDV